MTVTLDELRRARPTLLREVAGLVRVERMVLEQVLAELVAARVAAMRWSGPAAVAASAERDDLLRTVQAVCRGLSGTYAALLRAADELDRVGALLRRADGLAADAGGRVDAAGRLVLPPRVLGVGDVAAAALAEREADRLRWEVEGLASRAVEGAQAADRELARALTEAVAEGACFPVASPDTRLRPPVAGAGVHAEAVVYANSAWWQALSDQEQEWVIAEHPEWVGPRDGIPPAVRHAANLLLLARAERSAAQALAEAERRRLVADAVLGVGLQGLGMSHDERRRVEELAAVREVVSQADGVPRQLLLLDPSGPLLKAAVSSGDVGHAEHVVTFVGGLTTTVGGDLRKYDRTFTRMRAKGRAQTGGGDVAIVTWMGYPAPQFTEIPSLGGRSVLSDRIARDNATALAAFVNGVEAARAEPVHQTLWAHSYGSVLGGFALRHNTAYDDVVLFGSPGVAFTSLSEAGLKPGALNVLRADWDLVGYSGWHLRDPAHVPGVTMLSTDWSKPTGLNPAVPSTGHSEYLKAGSTSEHNLIAVAIGRSDLRVPE